MHVLENVDSHCPQGDVESVAQKSPMQLTDLIEHISGSSELKDQYNSCLRNKEDQEQERQRILNKRNSVVTERNRMKQQKDEAERYNRKKQQQVCHEMVVSWYSLALSL